MEMGNGNEEMKRKKWRNGGNRSDQDLENAFELAMD